MLRYQFHVMTTKNSSSISVFVAIYIIFLQGVNVDITGVIDGLHPARINVTSPYGETPCHDIELTAAGQSILFYFNQGVIPNGQRFEACITLLDINNKICVNGLNHQGRQHESVQLHMPM